MDKTIPVVSLSEFVREFDAGLLDNVKQSIPPVYQGELNAARDLILDGLSRQPFTQQRDRVHAATHLLLDQNERAVVINGEMGTGKTMMGICAAELLRHEGYARCLVVCPPHLVYKWRREIKNTVPDAKVWILNGPDTLAKLIKVRERQESDSAIPEYFVLGRVRMRMGFNWVPSYNVRTVAIKAEQPDRVCICPKCGSDIKDEDGEPYRPYYFPSDHKRVCKAESCKEPLWQLIRPGAEKLDRRSLVKKSLKQFPLSANNVLSGSLRSLVRIFLVTCLKIISTS